MQKEISQALQVLQDEGLILYPSDTIWGIGCDATNENAVAKVFELKQRTESKALISLVGDKKQLMTITNQVPKQAKNDKPTTIIYKNISGLAKNLIAYDGSAALRIVQDHFCKQLIQNFGKPIVSTSANISGESTPNQFSEISDEIKNNVDYIVNLRLNEIMTTPSEILLIDNNGNIYVGTGGSVLGEFTVSVQVIVSDIVKVSLVAVPTFSIPPAAFAPALVKVAPAAGRTAIECVPTFASLAGIS